MINKEDVINYLRNHKEDILDVCQEFNLHIDFHNREEIMKAYQRLKDSRDHFKEKSKEDKKWKDTYYRLKDETEDFKKLYHIFQPEFDKDSEMRWIPEDFNEKAKDVFEFRKTMYGTQDIYEDYRLDEVICQDMSATWDKMGGQDGMYENFPFTISFKGEVDKHDYINPRYNPESDYEKTKVYHYRTEIARSYCLSGSGGLGIIETLRYTRRDEEKEESVHSTFQIVTLGEDDGYHFLNSRRIYEELCSGGQEGMLKMLWMVTEEFRKTYCGGPGDKTSEELLDKIADDHWIDVEDNFDGVSREEHNKCFKAGYRFKESELLRVYNNKENWPKKSGNYLVILENGEAKVRKFAAYEGPGKYYGWVLEDNENLVCWMEIPNWK